MDHFISQRYTKAELLLLNQCRLYLQVLSLTDICSADGREIAVPIYEGQKLSDKRSQSTWPEQQRPGKEAWMSWRAALECLSASSISQRPLGKWLSQPHQQWFWYMDPHTSVLFHHPNKEDWYNHTPLSRSSGRSTQRNNTPFYDITSSNNSLPPNNLLSVTLSTKDSNMVSANVSIY